MAIDVLQAAKHLCKESDWELTNLELQKMIYIAYMFYWGKMNEPLFKGRFQAWYFGPVYPELYHKLKKFRKIPVEQSAFRRVEDLENIKNGENGEKIESIIGLLGEILEHYPPGSGAKLIAYTHRPGTAWSRTYTPGIKNLVISNDDIKKGDLLT